MTAEFRFFLGLTAMLLLLLLPGIAIFLAEGHLVQILAGAHLLPLTILQNKWPEIPEDLIGVMAIAGTTFLLGLFLWIRRWWVVVMTGVYVFGQLLLFFGLLSLMPRQT